MKVIRIHETAKDTAERISPVDPKERTPLTERGIACTITLRPDSLGREFIGFGGAITESVGFVASRLNPEKRAELVKAYFSQREGNAYTLARTHMNSCDFSLENWAYVEREDEGLESFSMDRTDKYLTPLLKAAMAEASVGGARLGLMVSPWSPPAWMKDNRDMNHGGKLLPRYRDAWARYFARFLSELEARGLYTWAVSVQNEPAANQVWDSCLWTAKEEGDFVGKYLGPTLGKAGFSDVKILVWDHNRDLLLKRFRKTMMSRNAKKYVSGAAFHWYSGDQYDHVAEIARRYPDKLLVFSEGCVEGGPRPGAWFSGERYAHNVINDLNAGCQAWIDWNLALDTQGGPNHVGNYCDAPILVDPDSGKLLYQSSYYYLGQFSRFIRPGSRHVDSSVESYMTPATVDGRMGNQIEFTAFRNPDGKIAFVLCNRTEADAVYRLKLGNESLLLYCPARGIQTLELEP
jgi:glucosylceramidase